jgi:hypothetical protein
MNKQIQWGQRQAAQQTFLGPVITGSMAFGKRDSDASASSWNIHGRLLVGAGPI